MYDRNWPFYFLTLLSVALYNITTWLKVVCLCVMYRLFSNFTNLFNCVGEGHLGPYKLSKFLVELKLQLCNLKAELQNDKLFIFSANIVKWKCFWSVNVQHLYPGNLVMTIRHKHWDNHTITNCLETHIYLDHVAFQSVNQLLSGTWRKEQFCK